MKFLGAFLLLIAFTFLLYFLLWKYVGGHLFPKEGLIHIAVASILVLISQQIRKENKRKVTLFLLSTSFRFFISILYIALLAVWKGKEAIPGIIIYLIVYFLFILGEAIIYIKQTPGSKETP